MTREFGEQDKGDRQIIISDPYKGGGFGGVDKMLANVHVLVVCFPGS